MFCAKESGLPLIGTNGGAFVVSPWHAIVTEVNDTNLFHVERDTGLLCTGQPLHPSCFLSNKQIEVFYDDDDMM